MPSPQFSLDKQDKIMQVLGPVGLHPGRTAILELSIIAPSSCVPCYKKTSMHLDAGQEGDLGQMGPLSPQS